MFKESEACFRAVFDTEMLARPRRNDYIVGRLGVYHYPLKTGSHTGTNWRVIFRAFTERLLFGREIRRTTKGARPP